MSKKDREVALQILYSRLHPLLEKSLELEIQNDNSVKQLMELNQNLKLIIADLFQFIKVTKIIEQQPTNQGNKTNDENQIILEKAFEDFFNQHKREPNESEWYSWLEQDCYNPYIKSIVAENNKFSKTKNGWGKEKLRKDLAKFKTLDFKIMKLLKTIHSTN